MRPESQADQYYELLSSFFQEIVQSPELGKIYAEIDNTLVVLRVGKDIVFYRVVTSGDIEIVRILHQRMDHKSRRDE